MTRLSQPLAKLSRPRLFDSLPRERLFGILDGLRHHPLIWIAAPPGAGKTTLVASWLEARKLAGIWYQIDSGDADPATFFYYLRLASQPWQRRQTPLPLLTPEFLGDITGFARRFFRELLPRLGCGHVLVLDNLHELPEGSPLMPALAAAAGEVPAGMQILLVSREEPRTAFARLAANRALSVLGPEALRLTPEETAAIAAARIEVDAERARQLYRLSAGWAAGLSLIVERIRRGLTGATIGEPDSHQEVFDYFAGEIHDRASPDNQQIVLSLCFFPRFTPDQAVAASGNAQAPRLLDYLYRRHLFVERHTGADSSQPVYQFHALFQAFLRRQVANAFPRTDQLALARTTAELLEKRGETDDAVPLYLEAEAWDSAARLICQHAQRYLRQGRRQSLTDWIGRLPQQVVDRDPWLLYWAGSAAGIDPAAARQRLERAYQVAGQSGDWLCQAQSAAAIVETIFLEYTQFGQLEQWIPVLERALHENLAFPDPGSELRVHAALVGASFHWQGNPPALTHYVLRACELLSSDADVNLLVVSATYLLRYGTGMGAKELVEQLLARLEPLLDHPELSPLTRGLCELFVGWSYVGLLDKDKAHLHAARLELIAKERSLPQLRRFAGIIGWWVEIVRQRHEEARRWLAVMAQVADPNRPYDAATLALMRAWSALAVGDSKSGLEATKTAVGLYDRLGSSWHRLLARGTLMWAYVEQGDFASTQRCIEETAALSARYNIDAYDVHRHQARAMIALKQGDRPGLRASLIDLFACASRHGTGMPARFFPAWMPCLCAEALAAGIEIEYVRSLIRAFDWNCQGTPVEQWPWRIRIYSLGRFAVHVDDQLLAFAGRAPKKTLNLLKALICLGGSGVRDHRLIDAIWPDDEADAARAAFSVTLHRLRKLLGHPDAILLEDGLVSLNPRLCWVDAFAFERLGDPHLGTGRAEPAGVAALELYRGNLLPGEIDEPWSASLRERLKARFIRQVRAMGERYEQAHDFRHALELYSRGLEADDLTEAFYHGLMRCHLALGSPADAASAYRRMRQLLTAILGIKPSAKSERLHAIVVGQAVQAAATTES
jgi:ATP/maltotriose-dependent transcriptional regulator MalT